MPKDQPKPTSPPEPGHRWVRNLMSREWVQEREDTPHCCSVGSERYWSM